MASVKERVAAGGAIVVVAAAALLTCLLAWDAVQNNIYVPRPHTATSAGDPAATMDGPRAKFLWRQFLDIVVEGKAGAVAFVGAAALVGGGAQILSTLHRRAWPLILISLCCATGFLACFVLRAHVLVGPDDSAADALFSLSNIVDQATYDSNVKWLLNGWQAWFVGFLALQLGISFQMPQGFLRTVLRRGE